MYRNRLHALENDDHRPYCITNQENGEAAEARPTLVVYFLRFFNAYDIPEKWELKKSSLVGPICANVGWLS
jgi:hypothetical protein